MTERPPLPKLKRGDHVYVIQRDGHAERYIVTGVGPTWVRVVLPCYYADVTKEKSYERRFLLADQKEGTPAQRYGDTPIFATAEQHAYDVETTAAWKTLNDAGLLIGPGPFKDRDNMVNLANVIREMWPNA